MRVLSVLFVSGALLVAACGSGGGSPPPAASGPAVASPSAAGSGGPEIIPILVNSEILKGPNRFVFSLTDRANKLVAAPDVKVHLLYYDVDTAENTVVFEGDARFLWAIEGEQGLYVTDVTFPDAGRWGTKFEATFPDGAVKNVRADYDVAESGTTPPIGAKAPSIDTPTAADVGGDLAKLSTDQSPDPRFYETSIADALAAGDAFVVTFATPAFCQTRLCGPTLETVKRVARDYTDVTFINVEPYKMAFSDGSLQPELDANNQLQPTDWTNAWGLQSEPYTFVVAADGTVAAKFEGVLGEDELRGTLDAL
ncbi:MAG: hypothetical protein M0Z49_05820 [Chloroflexi bacterium]|nr:hypothetical protein [Chloroflexota bacterium]MDA8237971.1 hypothetical protein [Chloroflexota bacterium]